jgi:hypothetical protein
MPFISDQELDKEAKAEKLREMIDKKREQQNVTRLAHEGEEKGIKRETVLKEIVRVHKASRNAEKPLSISDIKKEIEIRKMVEQQKDEQIQKLLNQSEIKEVKNAAVELLAITHTHPIKRKLFERRLKQSEIINNYVDNNVIFQLFNSANENLKAITVYGINYFQTNSDYNTLVYEAQARQQQSEQAPAPEQSGVEEVVSNHEEETPEQPSE